MGVCASGDAGGGRASGGAGARQSAAPTMLDMKLQEALKARAQKNAESGSKFKTFNAVMMKFATVESGFEKARAVFHEKDRDGNGSIDLDEFMAASNELSFSLSDDMKRSIFEESDFDGNRQIDFKEFVVMLALIHLLESTSGKSEYFNKDENVALGNAIDLATDAFLFFDIDGSGFISKDEVLQQMDDSTPAAKNQHRGSISRYVCVLPFARGLGCVGGAGRGGGGQLC